MRFGRVAICAVVVLAFGCGDDGGKGTSSTTWTVSPGESIQAAVDAASPGDTVVVLPGDYTEPHADRAAVRITKPLTLLAQNTAADEKVRILPGPGQRDGILVEPENFGDPAVDGVEISGFTVEGFENNGIWLRYVNNFTIENNESINNLENGIWPTLSANGLVKNNVSYGSLDSALWVEASENVRVVGNELYNSPTGLEITVSYEITAEQNDVHDNTIGIGLYHPSAAGLPPLEPLEKNGFWHIIDNYVHDNNAENNAPPGSQSAELPPGGGILLLGVDNVDVQNNRVENNDFFGIATVDYCVAVAGTAYDCEVTPPEVEDTAPENNQVIGNTLVDNHGDPPPGPFEPFAADILQVTLPGTETTNCYSDNVIDDTPPLTPVTIPDPLPPC
jgi:parallel beta-helix repeat protein